MKKVKKHIQNWKDTSIADIPKLYDILLSGLYIKTGVEKDVSSRL